MLPPDEKRRSTVLGDHGGDAKRADAARDTQRRAQVTRLIAEHRDDLERFLRSRVSDPAEREDIAQDVFLRLARYDALETIDNPRSFLFRIAENLIRDRARRAAFRQAGRHDAIDAVEPVEPAAGPDRIVEDREALRTLVAAIEALPEPDRTAFVLSRYEELSYREIAGRMGISVKTVEKYIGRALGRLRLAVGSQAPRASLEQDPARPADKKKTR